MRLLKYLMLFLIFLDVAHAQISTGEPPHINFPEQRFYPTHISCEVLDKAGEPEISFNRLKETSEDTNPLLKFTFAYNATTKRYKRAISYQFHFEKRVPVNTIGFGYYQGNEDGAEGGIEALKSKDLSFEASGNGINSAEPAAADPAFFLRGSPSKGDAFEAKLFTMGGYWILSCGFPS